VIFVFACVVVLLFVSILVLVNEKIVLAYLVERETFQIKNLVDKNSERLSDKQTKSINIHDESKVFYQDNIGSHFMLDSHI
jgi:hypothetical protein